MPSFIYFIGSPGNPIKIGRSIDPERRLGQLQTACPHPLFLLALAKGGAKEERRLHMMFKRSRLEGEWFRPTPDLMMLVFYIAAKEAVEDLPGVIVPADKPLTDILRIMEMEGVFGVASVIRGWGLSGRKAKELAGVLARKAKEYANRDEGAIKAGLFGHDSPVLVHGDHPWE